MKRMLPTESEILVARLEYKLTRQALDDAADLYNDAHEAILRATGRYEDAKAHLEALGEVPADV